MGLVTWKLYFALRALIVALIALAATAGMDVLANAINSAFSHLGSLLGTYT